MMTQGEIEALSITMEKAAAQLELDIMKDIVRRIKANAGMTSTAEYQINRLRQLGLSDAYIQEQIQTYLKMSDDEMNRIFNDVVKNQYEKFGTIYEDVGLKQKPFGDHVAIQTVISAALTQTGDTFRNISQSLGFAVQKNGKVEFLPVAEYYQQTLDNAILGIATGAFDYNSAIKKAVKEMTRSGLRTVDYASGRSYRIESATRTALMTGFSQITRYMNEQTAAELGTDDYEVSYHMGARPTHQWWQGRVYSYQDLIYTCGLGTVTGLCGINCYHWYEPFIRGVSVRNYTDEQLDAMIQEENRLKSYQGKEYTTYTALQRQRKLELQMRTQRQDIALLKEGEGSVLDILGAQSRYRYTMNEYVAFSNAMKLPQQMERVYMDGRGVVASYRLKDLKVSDTTDSWAEDARKELLKSEKSLRNRKNETLEVYDAKGNYIMTKRGGANSVRLRLTDYLKLKGAVVTHNHPSGGSFSADDIKFLKNNLISELRVSTPDYVYYIRKPKKWPEEINSSEKIEKAFAEIRKQLKPKYQKLYNKGVINKVQRHQMLSDEVNLEFAKRYGLEYGRETYQ